MSERVHVDRIEGDRAVLLFGSEGSESGTIPARVLPPGTGEGAALELSLTPAAGDMERAEAGTLMRDLFEDDPR